MAWIEVRRKRRRKEKKINFNSSWVIACFVVDFGNLKNEKNSRFDKNKKRKDFLVWKIEMKRIFSRFNFHNKVSLNNEHQIPVNSTFYDLKNPQMTFIFYSKESTILGMSNVVRSCSDDMLANRREKYINNSEISIYFFCQLRLRRDIFEQECGWSQTDTHQEC